MKKKYDKIVMLLVFMVVFALLSWLIDGGMYNTGEFVSVGKVRAGLYDLLLIIYSAFYYRAKDILFIFIVGGCYGVLSQTKSYRKLVDNISNKIKGKGILAFGIVLALTAIYTSITNEIFALFCFAPFIVSVFLKNGYDRLTAVSAGFGGMFVGYLGQVVGTFGLSYLNEATGLGVTDWILAKIVLLVAAYVLFFIFAALHMKKIKKVDETKYDLFMPEALEEKNEKAKRRTKGISTIIVFLLVFVIIGIAYISWNESFGTQFFTEMHTSFTSLFKVNEVAVPSAIIGPYMTGFGEWTDLLGAGFVFIIATFILALIDKMSMDSFMKNFGKGSKRISKVAFIYGFAFITLFLCSSYPWPTTLIDKLISGDSFNIILVLLASFLAHLFTGEPGYCGYAFGSYLAVVYVENLIPMTILWRIGAALALIIAPTSYVLLAALTYADIPYTKWLKYIWKFVLSFILVALIVMAVVCYM